MRLVWCDLETVSDGCLVCRLQQQAVIDDRDRILYGGVVRLVADLR